MPDLEITQASSQIAEEMFGGGEGQTEKVEAPSTDPAPSPPAPPEFPLPKSWKKEMESHWGPLSPDVKKYIQAREADVAKGFSTYEPSHKNWTKLIEPFSPLLSQNPGVDPVSLLQNLMRNHLALVQSEPQARVELAKRLLQGYQIDPGAFNGASPPPAIPPELQQALGRVSSVEQNLQSLQQTLQQGQLAEQTRLVEAFAADPANKHFEEVSEDILNLLKTGACKDLKSAYETAIWANPVVRQKLLAKPPAPAVPTPTNVSGSGEGTPSKKKPETINDTIDAIVAKYTQSL
jgi:hypothetical protein